MSSYRHDGAGFTNATTTRAVRFHIFRTNLDEIQFAHSSCPSVMSATGIREGDSSLQELTDFVKTAKRWS